MDNRAIFYGRTLRHAKPPTLRSLRAEAAKRTNAKGHHMRWSVVPGESRGRGICTRCEAAVEVALPARVEGEALTTLCEARPIGTCTCGHVRARHINGLSCMAYAAGPRQCACEQFTDDGTRTDKRYGGKGHGRFGTEFS